MQGRVKRELLVGKTFPFSSLGPVNFYTLGEEGEKLTKLEEAHRVNTGSSWLVSKVINCDRKWAHQIFI